MVNDLRQPVVVKGLELRLLMQLRRLLQGGPLRLVADSGEVLELPPPLRDLLARVAEQMTEGRAVALARGQKAVTTQQGAAMLGMSRPSFIALLEEGEMPHHRVGNQRRVLLSHLLAYLHRRDRDGWVARSEMELLRKQIEESGRPLEWSE
jgi:excisionase family DNA binding protein